MYIQLPTRGHVGDDTPIETVNVFKYLGSQITTNETANFDVESRINAASRAFGRLHKRVWKIHDLTLPTKMKFYETLVLSYLLYASETWTLLQSHKKKLNSFHLRCLRSILQIKWEDKTPNETVLEIANSLTIENLIRTRRLKMAWPNGHISRMDINRLPQQIGLSELKKEKNFIKSRKNDD